ncbi:DUF1616 domain-containing protein [Pyrodictium occultum]|nr:DUF1616 domain-containing protein [Pyrodictium occultum]
MRLALVPAAIALLAAVLLQPAAGSRGAVAALDQKIGALVHDASLLYSRGANVTSIVQLLDEAAKRINRGDYSGAEAAVASAASTVEALKAGVRGIHLRMVVRRYGLAAAALALAPAAYILIPRVYLYLWFRARRGWIVSTRPAGRSRSSLIMDEEVFAVIMAVIVVASVFTAAMILRPRSIEPFTALGLLNEECKIGYYPAEAYPGENLTLCIFVDNHMGEPIYYKVVYKVGNGSTLPSNTTPSPEPPLMEWRGVLGDGGNTTFRVVVPVEPPRGLMGQRAALIFELWVYDPGKGGWVYTGRWNHLYLKLVSPG